MKSEDLFSAIGNVESFRLGRSELSAELSSLQNEQEEPNMHNKRKKVGRTVLIVAAVISLLAVTAFAAVGARIHRQTTAIPDYWEMEKLLGPYEDPTEPTATKETVSGDSDPYYVEIRFLPTDNGYRELPSLYPQTIPAGYALDFISDPDLGSQRLVYNKENGDFGFDFAMQLGDDANSMTMLDVVKEESVAVCGFDGTLYTCQSGDRVLVWQDEGAGIGFILSTSEQDIDLLTIANSVAVGEPLTPTLAANYPIALEELGDYRITELPEGFRETSFIAYPGDWGYVRRNYGDGMTTDNTVTFFYEHCGDESAETVLEYRGSGENITVNGMPGALQETSVKWVDTEQNIVFSIYSETLSQETLLKMAESVVSCADLP